MAEARFCHGVLFAQMVVLLWSGGGNVRLGSAQDDAVSPGVGDQGRRELVPAIFIFGDSLIDNGNNNNLPSLAKANYFPYGIDFNGGPTGRFSNGYTMVDIIAQLLGLPLIPAYTEANGDQMRYGVNYASAAAGILDITGRNFVGRIPFNQQISNFENTLNQITDVLGAADAKQAVAKSIFFIGMGSNDYLNNYLMPNYPTKDQYNPPQFADLLVQQYSQQLTRLYNLGARKFVISGLGLMGCIPSILAQNANGICSEEVNQLLTPFSTNTKAMINNLSATLPGSKYSYIDIRNMFQDLLANARSYAEMLMCQNKACPELMWHCNVSSDDDMSERFNVVDRGCCGIGRNAGQITCLPFQMPCADRGQYIFWDAFHPTEAVNILFGQKAFNGSKDVVYPMNIEELANV